MLDYYTRADFRVGQIVKAFHPQTLGVMHWATVTKVGTKKLHVVWHVTGNVGTVPFGNVSEID